ncbi:Rossmann-like and DUF2520 domain-containing protein [Rhodohalobacter mucosus]|uniref:DUF2520 domain-containing protein n=1 Tax=Rhodohalobacter mucosus TaxID=2079485 RepID=A0A316TUU6_9BACT|nr:Rossmann-like and DUF2520 domain-containing protein [Rhodohalobacter mucosus]PWN07049.1 hypothetical protein DDZ15_07205 [Rhodohalobacter mucosus]
MTYEQQFSVTIIGTGAVGSALQDFFLSNGYTVISAVNQTSGLPEESHRYGDVIFITTPDDAIKSVSESLAAKEIKWAGKTAVHCSGGLSSDQLSALASKGAGTASMHPIQTFRKGDNAGRFQGITISLEGDFEAKALLKPLVKQMRAKHIDVTPGQKQALHIGAVFTSNYLVSLFRTVEEYLEAEEIEDGITIMRPLVEQTMRNIFEKGTSEALTGPVSRGDVQTVESHLSRLIFYPEHQALYRRLGKTALDIARESGSLTEEEADKLMQLFE